MISHKITINNFRGIHLRSAGKLCKEAMKYKSKITILYKEGTAAADAKSVLGVLGAGIRRGDEIEIICEGEDEDKAMKNLILEIESGLEE